MLKFNGGDRHHALLREGLRRCHGTEGAKASFRAIILAMNNYFRVNNKNGYRLDTVDSLARSLSRIHHGYHVQNNQLKSETWDYLVREGYLLANDIPDDQNTVALNLANFFKQTEKSSINTDRIGRRYFGYKRALRDPEKYLVK